MTIRSRHGSLWLDPKWEAALGRRTSVEDVLSFVQSHWRDVQKGPAPEMGPGDHEPKITKRFRLWLNKSKSSHGISGYFTAEDEVGNLDVGTGEVSDAGRTDIAYVSDRIDPPLKIVFEFKKLKPLGKDVRREYCGGGVARFVQGVYSREDDIAFMVGMVKKQADGPQILVALKRAIQNPDMISLQRNILDAAGQAVTVTGRTFKDCDFETQHARDHLKDCPDILLGHFLLFHEQ
jgi:hypothetical protein